MKKAIVFLFLMIILASCDDRPSIFNGTIVKKEFRKGTTYFIPIYQQIGDVSIVQPLPSRMADEFIIKVRSNDSVYDYSVELDFYIEHHVGDTVTMYK